MFKVITEKEEWNKLVLSFMNYSVFQLYDYVKAVTYVDGGEQELLYYEKDDIRVIFPFIKRNIDIEGVNEIKYNGFYDIISPYGYGGLLAEGMIDDEHYREIGEYLKQSGCISSFIRKDFRSVYHTLSKNDNELYSQIIIRNLKEEYDDLYKTFERRFSKNVRKGLSNSVKVFNENNTDNFNNFLEIYHSTMISKKAAKYYFFNEDYFLSLNKLIGNICYFYAVLDDEIVSCELVLYDKHNCYSFLGGTMNGYYKFRANDVLKVEIIKWAESMCLDNYVLGGGTSPNDGIFMYKRSIAPNGLVDFYLGKSIMNQEIYNELSNDIKQELGYEFSEEYFPRYRGVK